MVKPSIKRNRVLGKQTKFLHEKAEAGDKRAVDMLEKLKVVFNYYIYDYYTHIFSLCRKLDIKNIIDIGAGSLFQAYFIHGYEKMNYLGINRTDFKIPSTGESYDCDFVNEVFSVVNTEDNPTANNVKFVKENYPCDILFYENNIAVSIYAIGTFCTTKEDIEEMASHLSKDFDRVLFNVRISVVDPVTKQLNNEHAQNIENALNLWKCAMPDFTFYELSEDGFIFGTKFKKDIEIMKEKYLFKDNRFVTDIGFTEFLVN